VGGYGRKIASVGPAVVGTQECQDKHALARISGYANVPDTDFQNPIFYNPAIVSYVAGSAGWMPVPRDNYSPRTITWAKFRLGTKEFWFFNTHLPHNHGEARSTNTHARIAQRLLEKRRELGGENMPTVVTGDMNTFASNGASEGSFESNLKLHCRRSCWKCRRWQPCSLDLRPARGNEMEFVRCDDLDQC
jgi:hypothetical protein